ncbi:uncharacterized protein [Mytilus edulis]|uniref:uncharacterized protein n=1 Tax=Mytilus edulis TaxID=6550 RepID=UPI0039EE4DAB
MGLIFQAFILLQICVRIHSYPFSKRFQKQNEDTSCQKPLGLTYLSKRHLVRYVVSATEGNATNTRLHSPTSWYATGLGSATFVQVRMLEPILVSGLSIQGDLKHSLWVTSLYVTYSLDCDIFIPFSDDQYMIFPGNADGNSLSVIFFDRVFTAKCLRVIPVTRHGDTTAMQMEVYGCVARKCAEPLHPLWYINRRTGEFETKFQSEQIVMALSILPGVVNDHGYIISYSRTCTDYKLIAENGRPKIFHSFYGHEIVVDLSLHPIRAMCLRISAGNRNASDTTGFHVYLSGCRIFNRDEPLDRCGTSRYHHDIRQKRVIGGIHSVPGEWPWLVSLHFMGFHSFSNNTGYPHLCGASLIHPEWVLSAAHCFDERVAPGSSSPLNWQVVVGEHSQTGYDGTEQIIQIDYIIKHNTFSIGVDKPILQDIALLKLKSPAIMTDYVNIVCLDAYDSFPPGTPCVAAGWGQNTVVGKGVKLPLHARIPILPPDECHRRYNALPDGHVAKNAVSIESSVICATADGDGNDSCQGDSGGPLVCRSGDQWVQVGIVSFGYDCGNSQYPGIYTKIHHYIDWITMTIRDHSDPNVSYMWLNRNRTMPSIF